MEVYQQIIGFGLPLEYYFADKVLSFFSGFFNPEMTFRLWDLLFLEGSASD